MQTYAACPVCGMDTGGQNSTCGGCKWHLRSAADLVAMSVGERAIYEDHLTEARSRWAQLGRYDQSPRGPGPAVPTSSAAIALGGGLI